MTSSREPRADDSVSMVSVGTVTCLASDGVIGVFSTPAEALAAALELQRGPGGSSRQLAIEHGPARVTMTPDGPQYSGPAVDRATQLGGAANPGQMLVSAAAAAELVVADLPAGSWLADLGPHRLRDLWQAESVFELSHADLSDDHGPLATLDRIPHNLPVQLSSFVGRHAEMSSVQTLLGRSRLVTLTGAGGCGKTRLAVQAAAQLAERWPGGVWWTELASLTDPSAVAESVAAATGVLVEPTGGPLLALTRQLRDRRALLCLDNCEHVLPASADLAGTLLRACPDLTVLTTSREPLGIVGETVWRVPSMVEDEAVALFFERASRVRPWMTLDETTETDVRAICRQLDGIPLGVELAAAWLRTLTPAQIAAGLDDRFSLLVRGPRGALTRHKTLEASIEWSHDLLDEADRALFRRLAVFAGGFTLDLARAVTGGSGGVVERLGGLVDKSLVVADDRDACGGTRFRLLETIRQFAADRLEESGEAPATRRQHFDAMLRVVLDSETTLVHEDQHSALARLQSEHDNIRAALDWGFSPGAAVDSDELRRFAASMVWLWYLRGHGPEGHGYLMPAIELDPAAETEVHGRLLTAVAAVAVARGQFPVMAEYAQRALAMATAVGDHVNCARAMLLLATAQSYLGLAAAHDLAVTARTTAESAGDPFVAAAGAVIEGLTYGIRDDHAAARPVLELGLERARRRGDRFFESLALCCLNDGALRTGDVREAVELAGMARTTALPLGDYYTVGQATCHLALSLGVAGDIDGAIELIDDLVRSIDGADHHVFVPRLSAVVGHLLLWNGDADRALAWFERDVPDADGGQPTRAHAAALPGVVASLRALGRLDDAATRVDLALDVTRCVGMPHLVAEAVEQAAWLALPSSTDRAADLHHDALAIRIEHGLLLSCVDSLEALATCGQRGERPIEAVRLFAAADRARESMGYPRPPFVEPATTAALDALRADVDADEFAAAWNDGVALRLDDAVNYARRMRGSRGRPTTGWESLTPTEIEVVGLVVEGLTNPAIGARLFMSRGTVKAHLSHVFAKLGVTNRTELATEAAPRLGPRPV